MLSSLRSLEADMPVRIQEQDFDLSTEIANLRAGDGAVGAVAIFVGPCIVTGKQIGRAHV